MHASQPGLEIRPALLDRLAESRRITDELFSIVRPDSLYERPIPERHRIVFYIGHLEAFDWNLLHERLLGLPSFHTQFDRLFAFGIDPVGGGLPSDQPSDWPSLAEVRNYVQHVRRAVDEGLDKALRPEQEGATQLLNVAIEHRLMHAETLAYMLHQLPLHRKVRLPGVPELLAPAVQQSMVEIRAGVATLGLRRESGRFGWDNEFEANTVDVPGFAIDRYKVTNSDFMKFVAAGGYDDPSVWEKDGWEWRTKHDIHHPVFWRWDRERCFQRTMFDDVPLPLDWPVYVSHAEANAYARWAGKSLPTEAQWHRAAYGTPDGAEREYPWGTEPPAVKHGNFDFRHWNPTPVGSFSRGDSAFGAAGMLGDGWEWTSTVFSPFPGFERFEFYPGYSADFFDGKHFVMKGGSPRTAACMLRRSFRNWFQPHYQFVYAGFRCVQNT